MQIDKNRTTEGLQTEEIQTSSGLQNPGKRKRKTNNIAVEKISPAVSLATDLLIKERQETSTEIFGKLIAKQLDKFTDEKLKDSVMIDILNLINSKLYS